MVLVPQNTPGAMPTWLYWGGKVRHRDVRINIYKTDRTTCNWIVENHHVLFVPHEHLPPTLPGNKFSVAIITVMCRQNSTFYISNTASVVFFLPFITYLATLIPVGRLADRMGVVLALLLTMASFKVSIMSWVPQKEYLTLMDYYILAGFLAILIIGIFISFHTLANWAEYDAWIQLTEIAENLGSLLIIAVWCGAHLWAIRFHEKLFKDWGDIYTQENGKLAEMAQQVSDERKQVM